MSEYNVMYVMFLNHQSLINQLKYSIVTTIDLTRDERHSAGKSILFWYVVHMLLVPIWNQMLRFIIKNWEQNSY